MLDETDVNELQQKIEVCRPEQTGRTELLAHAYYGQWIASMLLPKDMLFPQRMRSYDPTRSTVDRVAKLIATARLLAEDDTMSDNNLLLTLDSALEAPSKHYHYLSALTHLDDRLVFCTLVRHLIGNIVKLADDAFEPFVWRCWDFSCDHTSCGDGEEYRCTMHEVEGNYCIAYFKLPKTMPATHGPDPVAAMDALATLDVDITPASLAWITKLCLLSEHWSEVLND
ncbi:hypothetical protein LTR95_000606 [Oleoguttula sp. CCFEE 5521]